LFFSAGRHLSDAGFTRTLRGRWLEAVEIVARAVLSDVREY